MAGLRFAWCGACWGRRPFAGFGQTALRALVIRLAYPGSKVEEHAPSLHRMMLTADDSRPELNLIENDLHKRHIARKLRLRNFAGCVVGELFRMSITPGIQPSTTAAVRLAAHSQHQATGRVTTLPESLEREFKRGFSLYRDTSHLHAAALLNNPGISDIELSEPGLLGFLSRARAFENFLDGVLRGPGTKWDPWRVPPELPAAPIPGWPPLNEQEIGIAGCE